VQIARRFCDWVDHLHLDTVCASTLSKSCAGMFYYMTKAGQEEADAHRSLLCILRAIASGSILSPPVNDPTVCPLGLGGKDGSRAGPGFFFLSLINLMAPPRMVPPDFSKAVIYTGSQVRLSEPADDCLVCHPQSSFHEWYPEV